MQAANAQPCLLAFWLKPPSLFQSQTRNHLWLVAVTAFISNSVVLTRLHLSSSRPHSVRSHIRPSRFGCRCLSHRGYIVPSASHPAISSQACEGRERVVEHSVMSAPFAPAHHHSNQHDFMSHRSRQHQAVLGRRGTGADKNKREAKLR